jgi:predicted phage replisome organizer
MPSIEWIKLSTSIFDDEKIQLIEAMPAADTMLVIWFKLLAQAGKCNASGHLILSERIPYNEEMLATIFRRNVTDVRLALETFQKLGMIELENTIYVTNWEKHQKIETLDRVREQTKLRVKKHRDNAKLKQLPFSNVSSNDNVTLHNAPRSKKEEKELKDYAGDKKTAPAPSPPVDPKKQEHNQRLMWFKNWFVWSCQEITGGKYAFVKADGCMLDKMLKSVGFPEMIQRASYYLVLSDEARFPRGAPTVKGLNAMLNQLAGKDGRESCRSDGLLPLDSIQLRDFTPWKGGKDEPAAIAA